MLNDFLSTVFGGQESSPEFMVIRGLKEAHPNSQSFSLIAGEDSFLLYDFLKSEDIPVDVDKDNSHKKFYYARTDKLAGKFSTTSQTIANVSKFSYQSLAYIVYTINMYSSSGGMLYHLVFDGVSEEPGKELAEAVFRWSNIIKDEIWVYESGHWNKSASLYKSIHSSDWSSLVLKDSVRDRLKRDVEMFFKSKDAYDSLDIAWKRGILLLGPPGNGKTETIKRLLHDFKHINVLYVKTFESPHGLQYGVRQIFLHARMHSPCILVFEDLDSLVTDHVRSIFLNEMDGLENNEGILTIATSNHPERIDDAILNRPSRFDAKYEFALPEHDMRKIFALKWIKKLQGQGAGIHFEDMEETAKLVADRTNSWSFAVLKELFTSFTLRIAHEKALGEKENGGDVTSEAKLLEEVANVAVQVHEVEKPTEPVVYDDSDDSYQDDSDIEEYEM